MGGWRIRASAHSDGAFPWQWAAPWLNRMPLFMLFGEEAGFPPRDRWPFSHKMLCLDLACSGARQQISDDTAFCKQLPDAGVVTTGSTENWMTHRARNRLKKGTSPLRLDLPTSRESKQGMKEKIMGLRNPKKVAWLEHTWRLRFDLSQMHLWHLLASTEPPPTGSMHPDKKNRPLSIKRIVKFGQLNSKANL